MLLGRAGEYLTYKQVQQEGGYVRKGEKAHMVVFWKWIDKEDEETGEEFQFAYIDNFDFNDKKYAVLLTMDEEDPEMVIFEEIEDADGEITIASLDEADEDAVYDYYDSLCDEYFDDEDESEE